MIKILKRSKKVAFNIDEFFDKIETASLNFSSGIAYYLRNDLAQFSQNLHTLNQLEKEADAIQRKIENDFYQHALMPNYAGDIVLLLENADDLIDIANNVLTQFDVENPHIPQSLQSYFIELNNLASNSVKDVIPAARIFFTSPNEVKDKVQKVLFYNRECTAYANKTKKKIFHEMNSLQLSEKVHLRYFVNNIESMSDKAKILAHQLSSLVIKIKM